MNFNPYDCLQKVIGMNYLQHEKTRSSQKPPIRSWQQKLKKKKSPNHLTMRTLHISLKIQQ